MRMAMDSEQEIADRQDYIVMRERESRNNVLEETARWHDHQAEMTMNSLHCGDGSGEIWRARRKADWHKESAVAIRALKTPIAVIADNPIKE